VILCQTKRRVHFIALASKQPGPSPNIEKAAGKHIENTYKLRITKNFKNETAGR